MKKLFRHILFLLFCTTALLFCTKENTPPIADFNVYPERGDSTTIYTFDASGSFDNENGNGLMVRWDFDNDGKWETDYSYNKRINYRFQRAGNFNIHLEVKDNSGSTNTINKEITIWRPNIKSTMTDKRDGREYKIVNIGDQWWFAENLNYGVRINSSVYQTNNDTVEKYYYKDDIEEEEYGGLYQWEESMNYSEDTASQGICPDGWHIPSIDDWQKLFSIYDPMYNEFTKVGGLTGLDVIDPCMLFHECEPNNERTWRKYRAHGYYWTSQIGDLSLNDFNFLIRDRSLFINSNNNFRNYGEYLIITILINGPNWFYFNSRLSALPVRCVKDE